jgi:hypothetical protein
MSKTAEMRARGRAQVQRLKAQAEDMRAAGVAKVKQALNERNTTRVTVGGGAAVGGYLGGRYSLTRVRQKFDGAKEIKRGLPLPLVLGGALVIAGGAVAAQARGLRSTTAADLLIGAGAPMLGVSAGVDAALKALDPALVTAVLSAQQKKAAAK